MNILFLDADGVFNTYDPNDLSSRNINIDGEVIYDTKHSSRLIRNINHICSEYGLSIVFTSSWRLHYNINEMRYMFKYMDIQADLIGYTSDDILDTDYKFRLENDPNTISYNRGMQISQWIKNNKVFDYIVIDDDLSAGYGHENNFFQTDKMKGFNKYAMQDAMVLMDKIFQPLRINKQVNI